MSAAVQPQPNPDYDFWLMMYRGLCQAVRDPGLSEQTRRGFQLMMKAMEQRYGFRRVPRDTSTMAALHAEPRVLP